MLPQCDRSLHEERPHNTTFYASRANTVRPYGYTFADGLHGGVRAEGELRRSRKRSHSGVPRPTVLVKPYIDRKFFIMVVPCGVRMDSG